MRHFIVLVSVFLSVFYVTTLSPSIKITIQPNGVYRLVYVSEAEATAYNPGDPRQCYGENPEEWVTGAWRDEIFSGDIAVSRDLLEHPLIDHQSFVCVVYKDNTVHCGHIKDKMNERYQKRLDIAIRGENIKKSRKKALKFGVKKCKIYVWELRKPHRRVQ